MGQTVSDTIHKPLLSLYAIGHNTHNQFGLNNSNRRALLELTNIHHTKHIREIKIGKDFNIYIDINGNYWCCGNNNEGQCGIGNFKSIKKLKRIKYFEKHNINIRKLCTSINSRTTFWITNKYELYGNGYNVLHQIGNGEYKNVNKPSLVDDSDLIKNVSDVVMGFSYSIALCAIDARSICSYLYEYKYIPNDIISQIKLFYGIKVFSTCYCKKGGNGHGDKGYAFNDWKWHEIATLKHKNIIKISSGVDHSLFLQSDGILWECNTLNHNNLIPSQNSYFMRNNIKIKSIYCGYNHNLAIDSNCYVYSWGHNNRGQCARQNSKDIKIPKLIPFFKYTKVKQICCGDYHSYVKTIDDKHYLFGDNTFNQCVESDDNEIRLPHLIDLNIANDMKIRNVYLGIKCTIFALVSG
eukprot:318783_1